MASNAFVVEDALGWIAASKEDDLSRFQELPFTACVMELLVYIDSLYTQEAPARGADAELDGIYDLLSAIVNPDDRYAEAQWAEERYFTPDARYEWN